MAKQAERRRGEPSLREQIAESGETEQSATRLALNEELTDHRFLGREFLTWLVYHADGSSTDSSLLGDELETPDFDPLDESGSGRFDKSERCDSFRVLIGERVILKALGDGSGEITARGAATGQSADVRYAIAGGLTVREVDLLFAIGTGPYKLARFARGDRIWQAAANAENFDLKRVKLPSLLSEEDSERAHERLELISDLDAMLRTAYDTFLRVRLTAAWQSETVPRLRVWLARSILEKKQLEFELAAAAKSAASRRLGAGRGRGREQVM
jgi:hypothetical protein